MLRLAGAGRPHVRTMTTARQHLLLLSACLCALCSPRAKVSGVSALALSFVNHCPLRLPGAIE